MYSYLGYRIQVNDSIMSKTITDWSNVRSPSRAKRRLKRGFKQNTVSRIVPKMEAIVFKEQNLIIVHSQFLIELKKKANEDGTRLWDTKGINGYGFNQGMGAAW